MTRLATPSTMKLFCVSLQTTEWMSTLSVGLPHIYVTEVKGATLMVLCQMQAISAVGCHRAV